MKMIVERPSASVSGVFHSYRTKNLQQYTMQLSSIMMPYFRLYRDKIYINKSYYNWPDTRVIDFFNVYCISKRAGARFVVSQFVFISVETARGRLGCGLFETCDNICLGVPVIIFFLEHF